MLSRIILRALKENPAKRFKSAAHMRAALDPFLPQVPHGHPKQGPDQRDSGFWPKLFS